MGISMSSKKNSKRKKRGRNDTLYLFNIIFTSFYTISVLLLTIVTDKDISSYSSLAPYLYGELGIHTGFYVWKCKTENCRKYKDVNQLEKLESEVEEDEYTN